MRPIVLYGPPAVGKDTITEALATLDSAYRLFPLLKAGLGRNHGYRRIPLHEMGALASSGDLILRWNRYGNTYAVDRTELESALIAYIPVLHFAEKYHIETLLSATPTADWFVVELTCPRPIAAERLAARNPADVEQRLALFDQVPTIGDLSHLKLDTSVLTPDAVAARIRRCSRQGRSGTADGCARQPA